MCYRTGNTIAVKSGELGGNADTFMPIFSVDTLYFLVTDIFLEQGIIHFFWQLKYWNWSCYQFWLSKMYNKKTNINSCANYNGKVERVLSPER